MRKTVPKTIIIVLFVLFFASAAFPASARAGQTTLQPMGIELYLVQSWSGEPMNSKITAWQKIPRETLTVTMREKGQIVYGYLVVHCWDATQWAEWHPDFANNRGWLVDRRRERPRKASSLVSPSYKNLEQFIFFDENASPEDRAQKARDMAEKNLQAIWGFQLGPLPELSAGFKGADFPFVFWNGPAKKSEAAIGVRILAPRGR